jgi:hypothetical protein
VIPRRPAQPQIAAATPARSSGGLGKLTAWPS